MTATPLNETTLDGYVRVTFSDGNVVTYNTKTHDLVQNDEGGWTLKIIRRSHPVGAVNPLPGPTA
jgi:hypothetical protein